MTETEFSIDFRMQLYYLLVVVVVSDVSDVKASKQNKANTNDLLCKEWDSSR